MPDGNELDAVPGPPRFSRRQMLIGTSLATIGAGAASVAGLAWLTQGPPIDLDAMGAGPLSIGFVEGSGDLARPSRERWIEAGALAGARVIPSGSMGSGSDSLAGSLVRVTIHGLYPRDVRPRGTLFTVNAHVASPDPVAPYAFHAWMRRDGPTPSVSGRTNFQVLLDRDPRLAITLERTTATGVERTGALFGVRPGPAVVDLRPGVYLLALDGGAWDRATSLPGADRQTAVPPSVVLSVEPLAI
jgi:hypothetical protein